MRPARPRMPKVPPTFTTLPPPCSIMAGITARMVLKQPVMFSSTMSLNSSVVVSHPVLPMGPEPPATFTRMSMRPNCARAARASASVWSGSVRSQRTTMAGTPLARAACATGSMAAVSRPASTRAQPSSAKASVTAAPMPLAGPVITATLFLSLRSMGFFLRSRDQNNLLAR